MTFVCKGQTLTEARELYLNGDYQKALPIFEAEHRAKPADANLNHWYGVCLFETGGDINKAEACLFDASKKNIQDSFLYLGRIYTQQYKFDNATQAFDKYKTILTKNSKRKSKIEAEKEAALLGKLEEYTSVMSRLRRMTNNVEDIQIIDSLVVDKDEFLSAYKVSASSGHIDYFSDVFDTNQPINSTVYFDEKETKIYYGQPDTSNFYTLFSMEKLLDKFSNEKKLSSTNFGLTGNISYPFMMPDGVTVYFAAEDEESLGGYDLFVTRYNMNNDTYLTPERMNMPFNSQGNDYMMVVDEEKGVGWFASDRFQPEGKVCVYTFIPNSSVKIIDSEDEQYQINRALITSIKDTWVDDANYTKLIDLARRDPEKKQEVKKDFEFVIDDQSTYYLLSDFRNQSARDTYSKVVSMKNELAQSTTDLNQRRNDYAKTKGDDLKKNMANVILELERKTQNLENEIYTLEIQTRKQEAGAN